MLKFYLEIDPADMIALVGRHKPTTAIMEKTAVLMHAQVDARFVTQGASGGVSWPPVKLPPREGNPSLIGVVSLAKTFEHRGSANRDGGEAVVFSDYPYIKTHFFGCTIVPKKAKALWVPISERAKLASKYGNAAYMKIDGGRLSGLRVLRSSLGEFKYGIDYLLLARVTIPKRPMLPNSPTEVDQVIKFALKLLSS